MDFAEVRFPEYFPGHPITESAQGYLYRHYAGTGIYLGVREAQVYVLGGAFGAEALAVGPVNQYITPRPFIRSTLCQSPSAAYDLYATPGAIVGKNVGVTLGACTRALGSPQWRQTAGPQVLLPADKTQTLSFEPPESGSYAFEVSFIDASGALRKESMTLNVAAAGSSDAALARVTVRASHSVRMGDKVSVRAWPTVAEGDSVKAVTWRQIEGPPVELDTKTSRLALFTAPIVRRDTLIRLRATLHTERGQSDSDEVLVLVEKYLQAPSSDGNALWSGDQVSRVYAYQPDGPYSDVLKACVYDAAQYQSGPRYNLCTLGRLPLLAQEGDGNTPTVEQVMNRVLVSHDWLGRNFEQFLRVHDTRGDFRRMFMSVTAIVMSTHIRPSHYYAGTGAIYLDGDAYWLSPEERDTMNEAADYRSEFGSGLLYMTLWRYVENNKSIFAFFDPRQRITRTMGDLRNEAAWELYHELSHALDFVPPAAYAGLLPSRSFWDNVYPRYNNYLLTSDTVPARFPLTSTVMTNLGKVQFRGAAATDVQKAYSPGQIASYFSADIATDVYNYSTQFEDIAMTSEEALMQRRLGIRRDFAIADYLSGKTSSSGAIVRWGQRGRVGEATIKPKALAITQALTPWLEEGEIGLLPPPIALRAGESWSANLQQLAIPRQARPLNALPSLNELAQLQREMQLMQRHRHHGGKPVPQARVASCRRFIPDPAPPRAACPSCSCAGP